MSLSVQWPECREFFPDGPEILFVTVFRPALAPFQPSAQWKLRKAADDEPKPLVFVLIFYKLHKTGAVRYYHRLYN
jgi:hypothetical protein